MIYSVYSFPNSGKETNIHETKLMRLYVHRYCFFFGASSFNFKENRVLIEEDKPSEKIVIVQEELDCI